ncbi:MAG TPA: DNA polymerase I [Dongiaceae bacterium]|jgi:DNA polymerase-1|nr:DNA polymerase I [Dongiaceae bacterium]
MSKPKHVYLVDGSGYIFRAFHALPPLTRSDGTHVNAVLGFTNMLLKLLEETDADHIGVIFDAGRTSFRNEIYAEYKANRPEAPPELIPQFPLVRDATRAANVASIEMEGYEADDIIATYACRAVEAGAEVTIVSSDKDLMQLVNDKVRMFDPMKNKPISFPEVQEKFGVTPDKVIDIQALAGDSTDNVPGVPGIGVKTAAELINTYGSLEELLKRAGEIKQPKRRENLLANAELARISKKLVTLSCDVKLETPLEALERRKLDIGKLLDFVKANDFRSLATRIMARHGGEGNGAGPKVDTAPPVAPSTAPMVASSALASVPASSVPLAAPAGPVAFDRYELVQDKASLERWVREARAQGFVAFDTETTSLHVIAVELVGASLALAPGKACYIPFGHGGATGDLLGGRVERPTQVPITEALAILKPLLEDPSVLKIGHNIKFDICILSKYGIDVAPIDDTMLISYALEGGAHGHGMDELSELHLAHKPIAYSEVVGSGKAQVTFDQVPLDKALNYAAEDADVTLRLHQALKPRLIQEHLLSVYETIDRHLVPVVSAMECAGIKVDTKALQALSQDFASRVVEIEREIHDIAGSEFNPGSPKQLGEILFDKLKLPGGKKGKTGAYATGADILEELATTSGHPLPQKILDWRQLTKLKSTYTDALQNEIDPTTGRVHTSYALALTPTGRLSSSDPNLQNIPVRTEEGRKIRHAFVAEKGHKLVSVDYSQIELRLAADMADIPALRDAFREGKDIHAMTASQVFGVPIEGMDPMVRRRAKAINFGIIYGISAFGLAAQLGIPQAEARDYIGAYFARYPGIREYMERTKKYAREHGYVETLFGRRCHVPGINDKNPARRSYMERAAINAPLQGTAADIIKRAMIRIPPALKERGLKAKMLLQVHDELVFEVPDAEIEETSAVTRAIMEKAHEPARKLSVPLTCEAGVGMNWAEAH